MSNMILNRHASESIDAHFDEGTTKRYLKNEVIVQGDEEPSGVFFILEGYVKAYSISQLGQQNLLLIQGAHEILPLPWALDGPQKVGIFYEALSDVTVKRTSKSELRAAMGADPWLTEQILRQLVDAFTVYAQRIQNLGFRLPRERIIACLLDLSTRFGETHQESIVINAPITHQDIADSTNMSRETASRAIELLVKDKSIQRENHFFVINNEAKLKAELS
jgi:CRP-like cAMP-binding protein